MSLYANQTDLSNAPTLSKSRSYHYVDGLEEIYAGIGTVPYATFVFESAEKARACASSVLDAMNVSELEVESGPNLSTAPPERRRSYRTEISAVVEGRMATIQELIDNVGHVMRLACPAKEWNYVPVYLVNGHKDIV